MSRSSGLVDRELLAQFLVRVATPTGQVFTGTSHLVQPLTTSGAVAELNPST